MASGNFVITLGREFGSGGKDVGDLLAERLGVKCYDKELLSRAARESGFAEEIFEHHDEKPTNSFLYSLVMDTYSVSRYSSAPFLDMPLNHRIFLAQFDAIKKIAEHESCVMVGRCADYALSEHPNCLNVFICADLDWRAKRIAEHFQFSEQKGRDLALKNDKQRASYYNYYTSKKWGEAKGYHLCLDSSKVGIEGCAEIILKYKELM